MMETTEPEQSIIERRTLLDQPEALSAAYRLGTSTAIQNALLILDLEALKRVKAGFNELTFTLGVINSFFILFIFAVFPQHFWLLYLAEALILLPTKFIQNIRAVPKNEGLYFLDFCWIMNFFGVLILLVLMFGAGIVPAYWLKLIFLSAYGVSCGPLLGSNIILPFVAFIFHDVGTMTGLFIHMYPPMLLYVMRWKTAEVLEAWPDTFAPDYEVEFFPSTEGSFIESVFGSTMIIYFVWLAPYTIWQLLVGLDLPKNGGKFDTVYHSTMREGLCVEIGKRFWKRSEELSKDQSRTNEFEIRDFVIYAMGHGIAVFTSLFLLAYPCSLSQYVHGAILVICTAICTWRGARRYTYYSTKMYSELIQKHFAAELRRETTSYGSVDMTVATH